jgi:hypothetical protein
MSENNKKMMPIMASSSMSKQTYVASGLNAHEQVLAEMATQQVVQVLDSWNNQGCLKVLQSAMKNHPGSKFRV